MGRLVRVGFDLHFTIHGHTCWMETTISEDSPTSEAPLYSLDVEVLPPLGVTLQWQNRNWREGRSHRCGGRTIGRWQQGGVLAGLVRDMGLNAKEHLHG